MYTTPADASSSPELCGISASPHLWEIRLTKVHFTPGAYLALSSPRIHVKLVSVDLKSLATARCERLIH
eukprot:scaffold36031_cov152-Isochrysis_galbana.AAC.2